MQPKPSDEMKFVPVKARRTSSEVAEQLREMVTSGRLKVGDKLPPERELAQRLAVGRNALREALRTLETMGLVEIRAGKGGGAFVTAGRLEIISDQLIDLLRLSAISLKHLTEVRVWMSRLVAPEACKNRTDADLLAMEQNVALVESLFAQGRMMEKTDANIEFHNLLATATRNPIVVIMMRMLTDMAKFVARSVGPDAGSVTVRSRRKLLAALVKRDAAAASKELEVSLLRLQAVQLALAADTSFGSNRELVGGHAFNATKKLNGQ